MKKEFFNIEDLAQGRCAVKNDGTLEELREALNRAFPDDKAKVSGCYKYYEKDKYQTRNFWTCDSETDLPTQSVKDFLYKSAVNERHTHYDNANGSLYKIAEQLGLNAYEFDILKRIARCRKKGQFKQDLQKIKDTVDLYLKEMDHA